MMRCTKTMGTLKSSLLGAVLCLAFCTAFTLLGSGTVLGASPPPSIRISVAYRELVVGEPVIVRVCLFNPIRDTIRVFGHLEPNRGLVDFQVIDEDSSVFEYGKHKLVFSHWYFNRRLMDRLAPGDSLYGYVTLLYCVMRKPGTYNLIIYEPGTYWLRAVYHHWDIDVLSEPVEIHVSPTPSEELAARKLFLSKETLYFIGGDMESGANPASWEAYHELVTNYPESVFAKYAWYYMARVDRWGHKYERAIEEYNYLLSHFERFPYFEQAEIELIELEVTRMGGEKERLLALPEEYRRNVYLLRLLKRFGLVECLK